MSEVAKGQPPQEPKPDQIKRRVSFHPTQAIGMPLIILIPLLGVFGVFDTDEATARAASDELTLQVTYPSRFRYETEDPLEISVRNEASAVADKVTVRVQRSYLDAFQELELEPQPARIDAEHVVFEFENLAPGESRSMEMKFRADEAGVKGARVEAQIGESSAPIRLSFQTVVLP